MCVTGHFFPLWPSQKESDWPGHRGYPALPAKMVSAWSTVIKEFKREWDLDHRSLVKKMHPELCRSPEICPSAFLSRNGLQPDMKFGSIDRSKKNTPSSNKNYLRLSLGCRKGESFRGRMQQLSEHFIFSTRRKHCEFILFIRVCF